MQRTRANKIPVIRIYLKYLQIVLKNASKQHVHSKRHIFQKQILGELKAKLAIEMSLNAGYTNIRQITEMSNSTRRHADNSGNHADL